MQCTRKPNNNGQQVRKKRIKKTSKNKTEKRNRQTNPQERETKSLFCGKPIFVARTNENSPVRFGTIKEGVK
jgi:hypothetical protein